MIGKYIALADWRISSILTGEYLCEEIYSITETATRNVLASAEAMKAGDKSAYEKLIYGLLMSGIAMQMLGNSRCASGAEHHISHLIEMRPEGLALSSDALHGEKVGVGTLIALGIYHELVKSGELGKYDYVPADRDYITKAFGEVIGASIIAENEKDACLGITGEAITAKLDEIKAVVDALPARDDLLKVYQLLGSVATLSDIGISNDMVDKILEFSPLVRNRLTLMRLRRSTLRSK
jgi:glycerol-1-phosphate dehydrogenase [NAD(P)+]